MSYLKIHDLNGGYHKKEKPILKNISIECEKGSFISILGENGSGKSTLMKTMAGLLTPWGGSVLLKDKDIHRLSNRERSKYLSVVLTDRVPGGIINVEELVAMGRYPYQNWSIAMTAKDREVVNSAIKSCNIDALRKKVIHELSDGQRQKSMIARALAQETGLLLLDEPTNHLDIRNKYAVMELLKDSVRNGITVIMTSHDIDLARKFCDEMWLLPPGGNIISGEPQTLIDEGKLDEIFHIPVKDLLKVQGK